MENLQKFSRCHDCPELRPLSEFYLRCRKTKTGKTTYTKRDSYCKVHWNKRTAAGNRKRPANTAFQRYRDNAKAKNQDFSITLETVRNLLGNACTYCGEKELMSTLDRVDNDKGYTENNVVPACLRCNLVKADMPMDAWMKYVAPAMRAARESGAFGEWSGRKNFNTRRADIIK